MKRNDSNIKNVPTLVTACCILHNLCELHGDACEEEWVMSNELDNATSASVTSAVATTSASRIREALCDYPGQWWRFVTVLMRSWTISTRLFSKFLMIMHHCTECELRRSNHCG